MICSYVLPGQGRLSIDGWMGIFFGILKLVYMSYFVYDYPLFFSLILEIAISHQRIIPASNFLISQAITKF